MCSGPLSPPMNSAARSISARSSASDELFGAHDAAPAAGPAARRAPLDHALRPPRDRTVRRSRGPSGRPVRRARPAASSANDCSGQRRNGLPALTCSTMTRRVGRDAERAQPRVRSRGAAAASTGISTRSRSRSAGAASAASTAASRSHWFSTEWRGAQLARPMDDARVHPAAPGDIVADAHRRAAQPTSARRCAARRANRSRRRTARARRRRAERQVVDASARQPRGRCDDDRPRRGAGLPATTGAAARFDQIRRARASGNRRRSARTTGVVNTTSPIRRRRTSRILNAASVLDRRLVDQHHRDVVLDRIHAVARVALQAGAVLDERAPASCNSGTRESRAARGRRPCGEYSVNRA